MEELIKMLWVNNKFSILAIDKVRNDPSHLISLRQKLKDCQREIIDLANKEGVDLNVV